MSMLKDFSDEVLIAELRSRQYAFTVWNKEDVDMHLEDLLEWKKENGWENIEITDDEKYQLLVPIVQTHDKHLENVLIEDAIIELLNSKNVQP